MAAIGHPGFAHCGAHRPNTVLSRANMHLWEGLVGTTQLPMGLHILPLPPNDHSTTAQGCLGVIRCHPKIVIFQPTHAGLKTAESSLVGPGSYRRTSLR